MKLMLGLLCLVLGSCSTLTPIEDDNCVIEQMFNDGALIWCKKTGEVLNVSFDKEVYP